MSYLSALGRVGQHRAAIDVVPTVTAGAYSNGDAVGGLLTFTNASHGVGHSGVVEAIRLVDRAAQSAVAYELALFDQSFTAVADNAAIDFTDADLDNMVGVIGLANAEHSAFADNLAFTTILTSPLPFVTVGTGNLYGQLIVRSVSVPTYAATTDVRIRLYVRRD